MTKTIPDNQIDVCITTLEIAQKMVSSIFDDLRETKLISDKEVSKLCQSCANIEDVLIALSEKKFPDIKEDL